MSIDLTVKQAMERLQISRAMACFLYKIGERHLYKIGRHSRITEESVEKIRGII